MSKGRGRFYEGFCDKQGKSSITKRWKQREQKKALVLLQTLTCAGRIPSRVRKP